MHIFNSLYCFIYFLTVHYLFLLSIAGFNMLLGTISLYLLEVHLCFKICNIKWACVAKGIYVCFATWKRRIYYSTLFSNERERSNGRSSSLIITKYTRECGKKQQRKMNVILLFNCSEKVYLSFGKCKKLNVTRKTIRIDKSLKDITSTVL